MSYPYTHTLTHILLIRILGPQGVQRITKDTHVDSGSPRAKHVPSDSHPSVSSTVIFRQSIKSLYILETLQEQNGCSLVLSCLPSSDNVLCHRKLLVKQVLIRDWISEV